MSALLKSHHASHASSFCIKQCLLLSHHNSHIFVFLFIVDGSCSNFQHIFFNTTKPIFHQSWCSAKWDRDVLLTESVSYVIYIFLAVWPRTFIRVKYSLLMQNWFDNWPKHLAQWPLEPLNSHLVKTFVYFVSLVSLSSIKYIHHLCTASKWNNIQWSWLWGPLMPTLARTVRCRDDLTQ